MSGEDGIAAALREIDTPTLSNMIEQLKVRSRVSGFADRSLRCLFPELGVMCGYAVTVEVDSICADRNGGLDAVFVELCRACEASARPTVVVMREVGPHPEFSVHCGEVMATVFKKVGAVGLVCDGAVRDIEEVGELGFHYFAPGAAASHGTFRIVRVQVPVTVCGLRIAPGDLLHGDVNGLLKVPEEKRDSLPEHLSKVRERERKLMTYVNSDSFTLDGLEERLTH